MPPELPPALVARLREVHSVGVITGAGISAESGIQTYRGSGGIYDDPEEGDRTVEALTGSTLHRDPDLTWRTLAGLARQARSARPNPGHEAIVAMERKMERFVLLTQNVDGLHQLAGSQNIIDIHGNIFTTLCMSCAEPGQLDRDTLAGLDAAPRCPRCNGTLRPDTVLFGEVLPLDKVKRLREELSEAPPDLVIAAGTSALFPYIAEPVLLARHAGCLTVEVNPEPTVLTAEVEYHLQGRAGEYLPLIAEAL